MRATDVPFSMQTPYKSIKATLGALNRDFASSFALTCCVRAWGGIHGPSRVFEYSIKAIGVRCEHFLLGRGTVIQIDCWTLSEPCLKAVIRLKRVSE